jgi:hypothetical protein
MGDLPQPSPERDSDRGKGGRPAQEENGSTRARALPALLSRPDSGGGPRAGGRRDGGVRGCEPGRQVTAGWLMRGQGSGGRWNRREAAAASSLHQLGDCVCVYAVQGRAHEVLILAAVRLLQSRVLHITTSSVMAARICKHMHV